VTRLGIKRDSSRGNRARRRAFRAKLIRPSKGASYVKEVISRAYRFRRWLAIPKRVREGRRGEKSDGERRRRKGRAKGAREERGTEGTSNIRKMLVCGHVRRERDKGCWVIHMERVASVCVRARARARVHWRWSGSTAGKHKTDAGNNTHPAVAPPRSAPRARKNRNMAVASHALFALLFCTPAIPRTID